METSLKEGDEGGGGHALSEPLASGIIRMASCLGLVQKAMGTWDQVVKEGVSRKRRMYAAILNLLAKSVSNSEIAGVGMDASVACGAGGSGGGEGGGEREVVGGGWEIDFLQVGLTILDDSLEHQVDLLFLFCMNFFFWMTPG
jgi:hypothetical protein